VRGKEEAGKTGKEGLPDQRGRRKTKELTLTFFRLVDGKYSGGGSCERFLLFFTIL